MFKKFSVKEYIFHTALASIKKSILKYAKVVAHYASRHNYHEVQCFYINS